MKRDERRQALFGAIVKLLRPLIRLLLRGQVPYAAFADLAKYVYVEVADRECGVPGRKQTNSRIATITGLSRKEVQRVKALDGVNDPVDIVEGYHRAARVVSGWVNAPAFTDTRREPLVLSFDGAPVSFSALVKTYSGDMPPRAMLDELVQAGVVERIADGKLKLIQRAYIPKAGETEKLGVLGTDVAGLIATIEHNIRTAGADPYFQRKVFYDNLSEEAVAQLRRLVAHRGQQVLDEFGRWMSEHDRDANPDTEGTGRKAAGIGIYYFEDQAPAHREDAVTARPVTDASAIRS